MRCRCLLGPAARAWRGLHGCLVREFADIEGLKRGVTMRTKPRKAFDLAEVERLASLGLTREQIAAAMGASVSTIYGRLRDDEKFSEAVKRGEARGIGAVASKLMDQINEGNTTAMIFYLKSRAGWRESSEIRLETKEPCAGMAAVYEKIKEASSSPKV